MKRRLYFRGSLTVEASFIIPVILFAYVFVIYSAFYVHDRIQAQNYTVLMAEHLMKGCLKNIALDEKKVDYEKEWARPLTESWNDNLDIQKNYVAVYGKKDIQSRMLMSHITDVRIDCDFHKLTQEMRCTVTVCGRMSYPLNVFGIRGADFEVNTERYMTDAVKYLWQYR